MCINEKKKTPLRNPILVVFVSTTGNGWLAFLGSNKREIVEKEE